MNEKSPLEDLVPDVTPAGHPIEERSTPEMEALSKLRQELINKDLYFGGEKWEFGEVFSDGRVLIRRPGATADEPLETRERMLSPDEFRNQLEVVDRPQ